MLLTSDTFSSKLLPGIHNGKHQLLDQPVRIRQLGRHPLRLMVENVGSMLQDKPKRITVERLQLIQDTEWEEVRGFKPNLKAVNCSPLV